MDLTDSLVDSRLASCLLLGWSLISCVIEYRRRLNCVSVTKADCIEGWPAVSYVAAKRHRAGGLAP